MTSFFHGNKRRIVVFSAVFIVSILLLCGCETVSYYSQGIKGHLQLVSQVKPIDEVINNHQTDEKTRKLLQQAKLARAFAINTLKLPDNQSYLGYADLKRKNVTWNVVATKVLSMEPYQSCFPVVGCLSYRGYFSEDQAKQFAKKLQQDDYETFIGGSSAYSTLGWFEDPIVSPMLNHGEAWLLQTLFHELAHQQLYIKDDSDFNEAFATTVGQNGVRAWLKETHLEALPDYNEYLRRYNGFLMRLGDAAKQLKAVYESDVNDATKLSSKQQIISQLRKSHLLFKKQYKGYTGFDKWFEKPINNPRLALVSVYHELVPDFERWLKACNNNFPRFYKTVEQLSELPKDQRIEALKKPAVCKTT